MDFGGSWDQFLQLADFAYNNSYQPSIQMAPYEALYGRRCWSPSKQKSYANRKVRDVAYMVREKVLLRVLPMKGVMRFGKKVKLSPWYIVPFEHGSVDGDLTYDVEPIAIFDYHVRKFRSKNIASVKV
ncbi:uncharacterized protein [Nicotiana sylvestris]|uniref:uncharacterized protein n=1 Tax=Nicotiana sylvestris TaxID=4096 RepID=UPI00388CA1DF